MRRLRARTILIAGWIVFAVGCYPGYLSFDSTMRLYAVRTGVYTDDAPVMTAIWGLLEYVVAGPFPMLALQSGLFLFGLFGVLRTIASPRVAAISAVAILLFPPVFSPMSCIWPDSLMAGALVGAAGALLQPGRRWRIIAGVLIVIACACRMQIVLALVPIVFLGLPPVPRWKRAGLAVAATLGIAFVAWTATSILTVEDHHGWRQDLMLMDVVGTLRRAHVANPAALKGLTVWADAPSQIAAQHDAYDAWPLTHGKTRVIEPIANDDEAAALFADWRHVIGAHPGAYFAHRWAIARRMLGFAGHPPAVFDQFGAPDLLAPLHHRASPSDWEVGMQAIVGGFDSTPLFRAWFYIPLAILALYLARGRRVLRNLAISGIVYELVQLVVAPATDYRFSHWFVTTTTIALVGALVARRWPAQGVSSSASWST
jgi:hypothetical protein